jgi:hypothetical protein
MKTPCALRRGWPVARLGPLEGAPDSVSKRAARLAPAGGSSCMGARPPLRAMPLPPPLPPPPAVTNGLLSTPLVGM